MYLYRVFIKSIENNFFLTWLYVAACSHRAGSVMGGLTFKTRQASVACESMFSLYRVLVEPCRMTWLTKFNERFNSSTPSNFVLDWGNRVRRRWAWFAKCPRMKPCHKPQFLSGASSSKMAERVWRTSPALDGHRRQEPTTMCNVCVKFWIQTVGWVCAWS